MLTNVVCDAPCPFKRGIFCSKDIVHINPNGTCGGLYRKDGVPWANVPPPGPDAGVAKESLDDHGADQPAPANNVKDNL